jgi:hypothetical protein
MICYLAGQTNIILSAESGDELAAIGNGYRSPSTSIHNIDSESGATVVELFDWDSFVQSCTHSRLNHIQLQQ